MNTQNNNFTVENLVAKYYNYVEEHCPCDWRDEEGRKHYDEPSSWTSVGEQLLIVLYRLVEGNDAQKTVVDALSDYASAFYTNVLSEDEMSFLCSHYKEVVSYLFAHRDEWTAGIKYHLNKISEERERLVKEYAKPKDGTTVFIADTEYCDLAVQFPNCIIKGFTGGPSLESKTAWALGQIRMQALGIRSEIVSGEGAGAKYTYHLPENGSVDMVILRANADKYNFHKILGTTCTDLDALYDLLKPNGKMIFFSESKSEMAGIQNESTNEMVHKFLRRVIKDCAVESIVSFEDDNNGLGEEKATGIMLVISKSNNQTVYVKNERLSLSKEIPASCIDSDILWPSYYLTEKPDNGIALSEIVSHINLQEVEQMMVENKERTLDKGSDKLILSERIMKMVVAHPSEMANDYKDANLCQASLKKASDLIYEKLRGMIVPVEQPSILLYGRKDRFVVGYMKELPKNGMATFSPVACLVPKNGIDVRYVAALLFTPDVKNQITSVCEGDISGWTFPLIMDKIIVPNHTEKERLSFILEANYAALVTSQREMKKTHEDYKKAVRMRKHALSQSLSSIEATFYALNAYRERNGGTISDNDRYSRIKKTTVKEGFEYLSKALESMLVKIDRIADVEYTFSEPTQIDPELFVEEYIAENESAWTNFKPIISWIKGHNQYKKEIKDPNTNKTIAIERGESINTFMFPKDALKQIFENIISNALSHGFIDESRKNYKMRFSWETDGIVMKIFVENNGAPIPSNRSTDSLLEYGVSTALNQSGHNGIGCNEIDGIMRKYDGKVSIISSPNSDFTVKYVLTFNRATIRK